MRGHRRRKDGERDQSVREHVRACGYCFATDATEQPQCKHEAKMIFPSSSAPRRVSAQQLDKAMYHRTDLLERRSPLIDR